MDRLETELKVIEKTGFISYFLIVGDFVRYGRSKGVSCVARGSAAGSLVTYLLEISNVDPIRYGLLFERFLNPERVNPPDIDIDFADDRRGDVIEYVRQKYGRDSVAQIITFGTMGAKSVIRDVGRVMGLSYGECDRLAKMVPNELKMTLKKALETVAGFQAGLRTGGNHTRTGGHGLCPGGPDAQRFRSRRRGGHWRPAAGQSPAAEEGRGRRDCHAVRHGAGRRPWPAEDGFSRTEDADRHPQHLRIGAAKPGNRHSH